MNAVREVEHEIVIDAPAATVYRRLAEVENWPQLFPPTIHVEQVEQVGRQERIRIWAVANGVPKTWTSRRTLDPDALRIVFRQEVSAPPVAAMGGTWTVEPLGADRVRLRLGHDYRAVDDDAAALAWIDEAVDRNSHAELAALKASLEALDAQELCFSFVDTVRIDARPEDVYAFIDEADRWEERLPHVDRVRLTEDAPGLQTLEMDTRAGDGSVHTTRSHRVTLPPDRIVYKQTTLPRLLSLHTGCWTFERNDDGSTTAASQHTVVLDPATITAVLGPEAGVAQARRYVRTALSTNSTTTLRLAKEHAEGVRVR
jgi:aromatase